VIRTGNLNQNFACLTNNLFSAGPPGPPASACPGGPALPIECDPKRPWPQCPPQSYCYATNSVDIGPYYCCPVC